MGLCCSTTASSAERLDRERHYSSPTAARRPRSPPVMEEETVVKEVLSVSETPKPRLSGVKLNEDAKPEHRFHVEVEEEEEEEEEELKRKRGYGGGPKPIFAPSSAEEISEICSLTESQSTTATNDTEETTHRGGARVHNYRSPMKPPRNRPLSGELCATPGRKEQRFAAGKSPSRRSENSPGRRLGNGVGYVRIVQPKNVDPGRVSTRRGMSSAGEDPGEVSTRRSRSPAMRSGVGRNPSARRSGRSPGRVNGVSEDPSWPRRKKFIENDNYNNNNNNNNNGLNDESLDNPLVSLECFIFL